MLVRSPECDGKKPEHVPADEGLEPGRRGQKVGRSRVEQREDRADELKIERDNEPVAHSQKEEVGEGPRSHRPTRVRELNSRLLLEGKEEEEEDASQARDSALQPLRTGPSSFWS